MDIQIDHVSFSYPKHDVLKNITFCGKAGEVIGIMGPNGTGKTTLFKCICNILTGYEGVIRFDRRSSKEFSAKEIAKIIGFVPQETDNTFSISVINSVLLGRTPYVRFDVAEKDIDIAEEAIRIMKLEDYAFRSMNELSGGERQRVMIARALAQQPQIMILDEPTSSLDLRHQLETLEVIRNIAEKKKILILLSMHDLNLAGRYADRLVIIKKGVMAAEGKPKDVLTQENIWNIYGVHATVRIENGYPYIFPISVELGDSLAT